MKVIDNVEQFKELTSSGNVVIQFSATWCQPCKVLTRTMENVTPEHPGVYFYKVDIDNFDRSVLMEYNVRSVPKLLMFSNGYDVGEMVGSRPADVINDFINNHKK
jgi:thioredoxin 1